MGLLAAQSAGPAESTTAVSTVVGVTRLITSVVNATTENSKKSHRILSMYYLSASQVVPQCSICCRTIISVWTVCVVHRTFLPLYTGLILPLSRPALSVGLPGPNSAPSEKGKH